MALATISATNFGINWPSGWGTSGTLKIICDRTFVFGGKPYVAGRVGDPLNQNWCVQSAISVASNIGTFAAFTLPQTDVGITVTNGSGVPLFTGIVFDASGTKRQILFEGWHLDQALGTSFSYETWAISNDAIGTVNPRPVYLDSIAVENLVNAVAYAPASTTQLGLGLASVTPQNTSLPKWVGDNDHRVMGSVFNVKAAPYYATGDGVTNDRAAIQAAQDALKALGAGSLYFPEGTYLVSAAIQITECKGIIWQGAGCINTIIKSSGSASAVQGNGVWYSEFNDLGFASTNALTNLAPFALDGNYDLTHTQGVQGNIFRRCVFDGSGSTYAYTGGLRGGDWQGSENLFLNCHWLRGTEACYYHTGFNAIANTIIGGDLQSYQKNGIEIAAGNVNVFGTSFESTYGYIQVINGGYDINASAAGVYDAITVIGCRTESLRFFLGAGSQVGELSGINYTPSSVSTWAATTSYALNAHLFKVAVDGSVRFYRATTAGTSGGSEPAWPNSGTVSDGSVVWTTTSLIVINLPTGSLQSSTGYIGFQISTGIPGNFLTINQKNPAVSITADYQATLSDETIYANATLGNILVALPSQGVLATASSGKRFYIKKTDSSANTVSVTMLGGNGIDGGGPIIIPGGSEGFLNVVADTVNVQFRIIGKSFGTFGAITSTAGLVSTSPTAGVGYATGAGGAVSQSTDKSTGVTLDKACGTITMNNAALNAGVEVSFTLTNSAIAANDVVVVSIKSGATAAAYLAGVGATAAGSCSITLSNVSAGNLSEAVVLNFVVIKGVNS